jgi:hypothetical protein
VHRHGRHFELSGQRAAVERLDIGQLVNVEEIAGVQLLLRERPEHEGVIGVRAVGDANHSLCHASGSNESQR